MTGSRELNVMKLTEICTLVLVILLTLAGSPRVQARRESVDDILRRADSCVKEGRLDDAIKEYRHAIDRDKNCATAYDRLALLYMTRGSADEARSAAENAVRLDPGVSVSYNILGIVEERRKNLTRAEEYYKKAVQNDPRYAKAYNNLGNIYVIRNDLKKAEETYRQATTFDPKLAMAHNNLAYALEMQGRLQEAVVEYEQAQSIEPGNRMISANLSRVKEKLSLPDSGASELTIAESICSFNIPQGFRLTRGAIEEHGGKIAIFDYNFSQRIIIRELPRDSKMNETLFAQMIVQYKQELLKLLEELVSVKGMNAVGQGYTDIDKRKVLYISTEFVDAGTTMEGVFSLVSQAEMNRNVLIVALAPKGTYRRDITESFLRSITFQRDK